MAETGSQGNARVLKHSYSYEVGDEWIDQQINETGIQPPKTWRIEFQLRELRDADTRKRARRLEEIWWSIPGDMVLREPTKDPEEFLDLLEDWINERVDDPSLITSLDDTRESKRRLKLAEFDGEMDRWIEQHGSDRLKLARSRNYKITSSYAKERALEELPECWVDTAGRAVYRERVDPTMRALKVETNFQDWIQSENLGLDTRIIWLVKPPSTMAEFIEHANEEFLDAEDDFRQQEALLIEDYLGKFRVFLPIDRDDRAPRDDDPYWEERDEEDDD